MFVAEPELPPTNKPEVDTPAAYVYLLAVLASLTSVQLVPFQDSQTSCKVTDGAPTAPAIAIAAV